MKDITADDAGKEKNDFYQNEERGGRFDQVPKDAVGMPDAPKPDGFGVWGCAQRD
jgi:hypothetical protein